MFERLEGRARGVAEARVEERTAALAQQLRELLPRDVEIEATGDGVLLTGRRLGQRLVLDASLRWTIVGLLK